jgi:hypothetical protein
MAKGKKTGGRTAGTPNKDKEELLELIREAVGNPDYHPVVEMAKVATSTDSGIAEELKFQANKEVAQYIASKRKAIEHSIGNDDTAAIFHMMFGTDEGD